MLKGLNLQSEGAIWGKTDKKSLITYRGICHTPSHLIRTPIGGTVASWEASWCSHLHLIGRRIHGHCHTAAREVFLEFQRLGGVKWRRRVNFESVFSTDGTHNNSVLCPFFKLFLFLPSAHQEAGRKIYWRLILNWISSTLSLKCFYSVHPLRSPKVQEILRKFVIFFGILKSSGINWYHVCGLHAQCDAF